MAELIRMDLAAPLELLEPLTGLLFERVRHGWEEREADPGEVVLRIHAELPEFCQELRQEVQALFPAVRVEMTQVPKRDWALAWREFFTAVPCGEDFIVIAPWMVEEHPYQERIPIIIEPKTAFGTGHHPTTALCLEVLSLMYREGRLSPGMRFLDLGTGSGILGLAAAKLGLRGLGLDNDPLAIENAVENKTVNAVGEEFALQIGSIEAAAGETFDLVLANILAEPLIAMAPEICSLLAPEGKLVLSGLLDIQREAVMAAYLGQGKPRPREIVVGEWAALVWDGTAGGAD